MERSRAFGKAPSVGFTRRELLGVMVIIGVHIGLLAFFPTEGGNACTPAQLLRISPNL